MILGSVSVQIGQITSLSADVVNGRNWNRTADESWRYTVDQIIDGDIDIGSVNAEDVFIDSEADGTVTPSQWLRKSGGVLSGRVTLADVSVGGDVDVATHVINDVDFRNVVTRAAHNVGGLKTFEKLVVQQDIVVDSVNGVSKTHYRRQFSIFLCKNNFINFLFLFPVKICSKFVRNLV